MEDADLAAVARVRAGDTDGFRTLVERHSRGVFRLAYRITGNEADAEDVVQEAFLRAYRQIDRYELRSQFRHLGRPDRGELRARPGPLEALDGGAPAAGRRVGRVAVRPRPFERAESGAAAAERGGQAALRSDHGRAQPAGAYGIRAEAFRRHVDRADRLGSERAATAPRRTASSGRCGSCGRRSSRCWSGRSWSSYERSHSRRATGSSLLRRR